MNMKFRLKKSIPIYSKVKNNTNKSDLINSDDLFNPITATPPNKTTNIIPNYVFQTWSSKLIPLNMFNAIKQLRIKNPEFKYYLYDDKMCRDFIEQHYDNSVVYAFDHLLPGAYKADLWRYCILYIYGGIYIDIKMQTVYPFKLIDIASKECFPLDDIKIPACWQGFLICKPRNPIFIDAIKRIYHNVKYKLYYSSIPHSNLYITGPTLLGELLEKNSNYNGKESHVIHPNSSNVLIDRKNNIIMKEYDSYRKDENKDKKYGTLYLKQQIYI